MTKELNINYKNPYHEWVQLESIMNKKLYLKFINWTSGEFDLFLQEELNGLKVYFPSGNFSISSISENRRDVLVEIKIISKDLNYMNTLGNRITDICRQIENSFSK